jgi:pentose-5-phosphate-3-epimerase
MERNGGLSRRWLKGRAALRKHAVQPDGSAVPIDVHLMVRPVNALARARKIIDACGRDVRLEVDGGVKVENIRQIASAEADTFVSGSAIFGSPGYRRTIEAMRVQLAV